MTGIPPRPEHAPTGADISRDIERILGDTQKGSAIDLQARREQFENYVYTQVTSGNVPDFMRPENWPTVSVSTTIGTRVVSASFKVCPDYLAIGSNTDYIRVPLSPLTAQRIADQFGLALPTARLVDLIDTNARNVGGMLGFVAAPSIAKNVTDPTSGRTVESRWNYQQYGFYEGRWMLSPQFAIGQSRLTDDELKTANYPPLRSGIKKDLVYDSLVFQQAGEGGNPVVIYRPGVQPLSNIHNEKYFDYSHGERYIDRRVPVTITEQNGTQRTEVVDFGALLNSTVAFKNREQDNDIYKNLYRLISPVPLDISRMYRTLPVVVPQKTEQPKPETRRRNRSTTPEVHEPRRQPKIILNDINQ